MMFSALTKTSQRVALSQLSPGQMLDKETYRVLQPGGEFWIWDVPTSAQHKHWFLLKACKIT